MASYQRQTAMDRKAFVGITAIGEGLTELALLALPAVLLALLLGTRATAPETLFVARVAGVALIAIGTARGLATADDGSPAMRAVLISILVYDGLVAIVLAYAGLALGLGGVLLWPAVVAHIILAIWGVCGLRSLATEKRSPRPASPFGSPATAIPRRALAPARIAKRTRRLAKRGRLQRTRACVGLGLVEAVPYR